MYLGNGEMMLTEDVAMSVRKITREASRKIAEAAFKLAVQRRRKVTIVTKRNVLNDRRTVPRHGPRGCSRTIQKSKSMMKSSMQCLH